MKSLIALAALLSASSAFATTPDDYSVAIYSYCDAGKVLASDEQGQPVVKDDCAAQGLTCKSYQSFRWNTNQTIFVARCEAAE